jgi:hypothetical protein
MRKQNSEVVRQIEESTVDPFLKDANLDTRGLPIGSADLALLDLRDPFQPDERFGGIVEENKKSLRRAIPELAEKDAEMQAELRKRGVVDEAAPRTFNTPGWIGEMRYASGVWHFAVQNAEGQQKRFKIPVEDAEAAMMSAARYLSKNTVKIRTLSREEQLYCARLAGQGKIEDCILNYLSYSIQNYDGATDVSIDPRYQKVCDAAAWFAFVNSTPEYQDSDEVRDFIMSYIGSRLVTVQLLRFGFKAYLENQRKSERGLLLNFETRKSASEAPNYTQLDELSTEEIDRLRTGVMKDRARKSKQGILQ